MSDSRYGGLARSCSFMFGDLMEIVYNCPECRAENRSSLEATTQALTCSACLKTLEIPADAVAENEVKRCVVCPSTELFARKDFPQRLGVTIIVLGFVASTITWYYYMRYATYAILFGTAALDFALYFFMGNVLQCYRCQAQYRGLPALETHEGFDLETHEKYRQQAIRLAEAEREAAVRAARQAN